MRTSALWLVLLVTGCALGRPASAEMPEAGAREQEWALAAAHRAFEAGRFEQALGAFESAGRDAVGPLPAEALVRWGIAASEAGWPLTAYFRLRQYLDLRPDSTDRAALQTRAWQARQLVLRAAAVRSRLAVILDAPVGWEGEGQHRLARLVARDGRAAVETLRGKPDPTPGWHPVGDMPMTRYLDVVRGFLDAPAVWTVLSPPSPADGAGARRAVALRLVVGDEEWVADASRGQPHEALGAVAARVLDSARSVALFP